ncbi:MAG: cytochrome c [Zymomonas mobilis subsp. pomaceae]|uniref:c-type cytochrome n=1 Tax=Zymomonas mobilis TaxID=542 RepID=UPI0039ECE007
MADFSFKLRSNLSQKIFLGSGLALVFCAPLWAENRTAYNLELIQKGQYLATAADCMACHTSPNSRPFSGGVTIVSPMGNIISTNITPDADTGIGHYSEADFSRALRQGIRKDGSHLYPAMPYTAYAKLSDGDIHALYSYFMQGVAPVFHKNNKTRLTFPFNIRALMMGWNILFLSDKPSKIDFDHLQGLDKGRYLADTLEHCGTCHSPRNIFMAEKKKAYLGGSPLSGWYAPNITASFNSGIGRWREEELFQYLKTGSLPGKARAADGMGEAVTNSLSKLSDSDLHALAAYIKQVPPLENNKTALRPRDQYGEEKDSIDIRTGKTEIVGQTPPLNGQALYSNNCASCHGENGGGSPDQHIPSLYNNTTTGAERPDNLVMTILNGVQRKTNGYEVFMPSFGKASMVQSLSDEEIARLANYVTGSFGSGDHHLTAANIKTARQGGEKPFLMRYLYSLMLGGILLVIAFLALFFRIYRKNKEKKAIH